VDIEFLNQLSSEQLLAVAGASCFVMGCLLTLLLSSVRGRKEDCEDPRNHTIRSLEADARTARREINELRDKFEAKTEEFNTSVATLQDLRGSLSDKDSCIEKLEADLKESVRKTRELRVELQERAAQSLRDSMRAEEAATEAEVARAGSEAVMGEIGRLQEERQRLSEEFGRMGESLLPDEALFGDDN
jgi:methyl-accepting chemotaxis protein